MTQPQSPSPANNVVAMNQRQLPPKPSEIPGLLGAIQRTAKSLLGPGLEGAFKAIDDDLFKRSEQNQAMFTGLREVRKRQPLIMRRVLEAVDKDVLATARAAPIDRSKAGIGNVGGLSLLDGDELEENLALAKMVGAAEGALAGELHALRQRMAVIRGGVAPEMVHVPILPEMLASAFREALGSLEEIPMDVRLILYKHFERHALGALGPLYHQINADLAAAGVLPDLKPQPLVRNHADPSLAEPEKEEEEGTTRVSMTAEEKAAWTELRSMIASNRLPGSGGEGPVASIQELSRAIAALRELTGLLGQLSEIGVAPTEVKEHLLKKLGQGTPESRSLGDHEDAIDTVGLVFDHVLNDPNLPPQMQALLARLQVPFIKVAVLEPALFAKAEHPARQMLDLLGETAKGWTPETDRELVLYNRIKEVVEVTNKEFVDDAKIFDRQREAFAVFVAELKKRAQVSQTRAEEVARQRDRMGHAQSIVTKAILDRTANKVLPEWANAMLLRHWSSYMVLLVLREGEDSQGFKNALFFVEKLVAAPEAKDEVAKKALVTVTPALIQQMRQGLTSMGLGAEDLGRLADAVKAYLDLHAGISTLPMPAMPALPTPPSAATRLAAPRGPAPRPESLEAIKRLKVDDWVEITDERGRRTRGKVSWISSFTHRLLLVTLSGTRLAEKSQEELALMLDRGTARLIESKPLFDRAMGSILDKFRS